LAVSAANTDLATSEALKFAREVDPKGERTLAVLTKLDLMDEGTDAFDVLSGRVIPLKHGFIGVVNRSQKAIQDRKAMKEQLKMEEDFLYANYHSLAAKNGTRYLAATLSRLLMNHIRSCLPKLKKKINDRILECYELMNSYGKPFEDENLALIEILIRFAASYGTVIDGTSKNTNSEKTKLYEILHDKFDDSLEHIELKVELTKPKDSNTIENFVSVRPTLFNTPSFDEPFEYIVVDKIYQLREPSLACIEMVREEMENNLKHCDDDIKQDLTRFPMLCQKIKEVVSKMLRKRTQVTKEKVEELIETETAYVNKLHPDFDKFAILNKKLMQNRYGMEPMSSEIFIKELKKEIKEDIIEDLIKDYFLIVRKSVQDVVTKTIIYQLVNYVKKNIQSQLLQEIYKSAKPDEGLFRESKQIESGRKRTTEMLRVSGKW
jgi:dynamin 1-like protein